MLLSILMMLVAFKSRMGGLLGFLAALVLGTSELSADATTGASSIGALTFLGRPLGRAGLTAFINTKGARDPLVAADRDTSVASTPDDAP